MAQGRRFTRKTINMSRESFDHCEFIECTLICETAAGLSAHPRLPLRGLRVHR
jgi:hypothetical protein